MTNLRDHEPIGRNAPELPATALATCDDLAGEHARLRARGVHRRADEWVVARPEDVATVLHHPAMSVTLPPAHGAAAGPAGLLQRRMARFSDGADHDRRRALLERYLPPVAGLHQAARRRTEALAEAPAEGGTGTWDVMPLARTVPVGAMAEAVTVPPADVPRVVNLVGHLADVLAPSLSPRSPADADDAADELTALLGPLGHDDPEHVAALVGLLLQTRDATAALIGAALLVPGPADARVDRAIRNAAPVQCTRRTPLEPVALGGIALPPGASVWVVLAAAEQGAPHPPATFGGGPHACPGAEHAVAAAEGVLAGLDAAGWAAVPGQQVVHEPRPNLRVPSAVLVGRR